MGHYWNQTIFSTQDMGVDINPHYTSGANSNNNSDFMTTAANSNMSTPYDFLSQYEIYRVAVTLVKVVFPLVVAVGTAGNTLIILVLWRGAIQTDNLNFFLSSLAVVDTVFLYTSALKTWLRVTWGVELLHFGTWSCKLGLFLNHLSLTLSAWLVVVIAWQRWYTCSRPFHRCCPVENTRWGHAALILLLLLLIAFNSYVLFTAVLHESPEGDVCAPSEEHDPTVGEMFPFILMALYSGLPALLLLVLNSLLARVLYNSRRSLLSNLDTTRADNRGSSLRSRYNYVTVLLLALSLSWLLLTTPHTVFKILEPIPESPAEFATFSFLNVLFFVFLYINHSINFFLYLALTRSFRRELKRMGRGVTVCAISLSQWCCAKGRRISLSASTTTGEKNKRHTHAANNDRTGSFFPLLEVNHSGKGHPMERHSTVDTAHHEINSLPQ